VSDSGEIHNVVFLDGIWLRRKVIVLVAVTGGHIVGWHLAQSECGSAWAALMLRIPTPQDVSCNLLVDSGIQGLAADMLCPDTHLPTPAD
jgi:hypothetical protein